MNSRRVHTIRILLLAAAMTPLLAACERQDPSEIFSRFADENRPDYESWDVDFYVSDDGVPRVRVDAAYYARFSSDDSTYAVMERIDDRRVLAYVYDAEGNHSATITADRLYYYDDRRQIDARGGVLVTSRDDRRLESEHITWYEHERELRTPGFVRIETPTERIQGYRLVADEDLETYSLARVTGQVTIEDID